MEIEARHFKLVEMIYHDMEARGIDLSAYKIQIHIEDNILNVRFYIPDSISMRGSPLGYPILNYKVDITSGEIMKIQGER